MGIALIFLLLRAAFQSTVACEFGIFPARLSETQQGQIMEKTVKFRRDL